MGGPSDGRRALVDIAAAGARAQPGNVRAGEQSACALAESVRSGTAAPRSPHCHGGQAGSDEDDDDDGASVAGTVALSPAWDGQGQGKPASAPNRPRGATTGPEANQPRPAVRARAAEPCSRTAAAAQAVSLGGSHPGPPHEAAAAGAADSESPDSAAIAALQTLIRSQQAVMESQRRRIRWLEQRRKADAVNRQSAPSQLSEDVPPKIPSVAAPSLAPRPRVAPAAPASPLSLLAGNAPAGGQHRQASKLTPRGLRLPSGTRWAAI